MKQGKLLVLAIGWVASILATAPLTDGTRSARRAADIAPQLKCTSLIVGKDATADGSVLLAHNEDLGDYPAQHYVTVQRQEHVPGETITLWSGVEMPQVEVTHGYTATRIFDLDYIPGDVTSGINEYQVAVVNNLAYQRDAIEPGPTQGRMIWTEFTRTALERARTAREGVEVIGELARTYRLGMDTGTMFAVADPEEGWWVEVAQQGQWAAERVADDGFAVRANAYRIGVIDLGDPDTFLVSDDLVQHATDMGWYAGGAFDFAAIYGDPQVSAAPWNTHREDRLADLLADAAPTVEPVDVMGMLRDHYEGTPWDPTDGYTSGSPHQTFEYCVCDLTTEVSVVCQSRGWLPAEIGGVCWRAMATPCSSVYVPWYYGHDAVPPAYRTGTEQPTEGSAYWAFRELSELVDAQYGDLIGDLRGFWTAFEADTLAASQNDETSAEALYDSDPDAAVALLQEATHDRANLAYGYAATLVDNGVDVGALGDDDDSSGADDDDSSGGPADDDDSSGGPADDDDSAGGPGADDDDGSGRPDSGGCGCSASPIHPTGGLAVGLLALLGRWRRRV